MQKRFRSIFLYEISKANYLFLISSKNRTKHLSNSALKKPDLDKYFVRFLEDVRSEKMMCNLLLRFSDL